MRIGKASLPCVFKNLIKARFSLITPDFGASSRVKAERALGGILALEAWMSENEALPEASLLMNIDHLGL